MRNKELLSFSNNSTIVYLAGKITPNGWRQKIIDIRDNFYDFMAYENGKDWWKTLVKFNNDIAICGPYFLSCDHSCFHGDGSHGLGINSKSGCIESYGSRFTEKEVTEICMCQINKCDIVFAYINDDTCFGSLYEIGYAKGIGKKVITVFDTEKRKQSMWFIAEESDYSTSLETHTLCETELSHIANNLIEAIKK